MTTRKNETARVSRVPAPDPEKTKALVDELAKKNPLRRLVPVDDPVVKKFMDELVAENPPEPGAATPDPWQYRSDGMRCASCIWFVHKKGQHNPHPNGQLGRCRRHAPAMGGYPVTWSSDWCGDHRLDETKV